MDRRQTCAWRSAMRFGASALCSCALIAFSGCGSGGSAANSSRNSLGDIRPAAAPAPRPIQPAALTQVSAVTAPQIICTSDSTSPSVSSDEQQIIRLAQAQPMPLPADGPDLGSPDASSPPEPAKPQIANPTKPAEAAIAPLPPTASLSPAAASPAIAPLPPITPPKVASQVANPLAPPQPLPPVAGPAAIVCSRPALPAATPPMRMDELVAVVRQADTQTAHGFQLGSRGAIYSARAEFVAALRTIADALDSASGGNSRQRMLASGLQALEEADDFAPQSSGLLGDDDLARVVASHQTPVLKNTKFEGMSSSEAMSRYLTFAQEQLSGCTAGVPAGSAALFGLGKIYCAPASMHGPADHTHGAKSVVLYQAALMVDGRNYRAANELGVLLAKFGRLPEAKTALFHSIQVSPQATTWQNLAAVHAALGEQDLANRAHHEALIAAAREKRSLSQSIAVEWLNPAAFAATTPVNIDGTPPNRSAHPTAMTAGASNTSVR